jgi:hypothetical protein
MYSSWRGTRFARISANPYIPTVNNAASLTGESSKSTWSPILRNWLR